MFQPTIGFVCFFVLIFFIILNANKSIQNNYDQIIHKLKSNDLKLFIEQTKCYNSTFGLNNRDYLFRKCDLYLTNDSIIILGYSKKSIFKQLSKPIILTKNINKYKSTFPFAIVKFPSITTLNQEGITIEFGESNLTKTYVKIRINIESEADKNMIKKISDNF